MDNRYLVSVIVPVYCAEAYLPQCIESILNQTYSNLELILIDDGSPDKSSAICDEYAKKDSRIIVIHQENKGVSAARNVGIDNSHGSYITFVDSDDELYSNAIEILLEDAVSYEADISSAVKCHIKSNGEILNPYENHTCYVYEGMETICLSLDGERQTNSACAKLFLKNFLGNVRFIEGRNINEDGFFLFQCYVKQPKVVQHNVCIYKYFLRDNSNSRNEFLEKYFDMLYFCERKKEIINKQFPTLRDKLVNMEVTTHLFFLEVLCRASDKRYLQHEKESIRVIKQNYCNYETTNNHEKKFSWIVAHGFFPVYKSLLKFRNMVRRIGNSN